MKKAPTCNSMNTSVEVQNRVAIKKTIDSGRNAIQETTCFFKRVGA